MLEEHIRKQIIQLIHQGVMPAVGCTEPVAMALCTARTTEVLDCRPEKITAPLSANILKNAMGMGIPGTGMIGLPITVALGSIVGKSEYQLEVIKDLTPQALGDVKKYIGEKRISIQLKQEITEKLHIEVTCQANDQAAKAIIVGAHTNFIHLYKNGEILLDKGLRKQDESKENGMQLSFRMIYDFATTTPTDEIRFMLKTRGYNMNAANQSPKGNYGHCLGKTMDHPLSRGIFGSSIYSYTIAKTALACDARVGGATVPVMSNGGSGNQGICTINPVVVYAIENKNTEEELIRTLTLSHLSAIYIKQNLGKLSALYSYMVASIGSSYGITYLMDDDYAHVYHAIRNIIAGLTGMVYDGAKPSYSLKISSDVSTAVLSVLLSMKSRHVTSAGGIVNEDVDRSIRNLTSIGRDAVGMTDEMVPGIVTSKQRY